MKKLILVCLTILLFFSKISFASEEKTVFQVVGTPTSPFKMATNIKKEKPGVSIEIIHEILKRMNVSVQFRLVTTVARAILLAKSGEADMLIGYSFKKKRTEFLHYPKLSYRTINWNFFIRKEDEGRIKFSNNDDKVLTLKDLRELDPYKISVVRGTSYSKVFWEAEKARKIKYNITSRNDQQFNKLELKRIDLIPMNTRSSIYELKQKSKYDLFTYLKKPLKSKKYFDVLCLNGNYYKSSKQDIKEFAAVYDKHLQDLKNEGFIKRIYERYGLPVNSTDEVK